MLERTENRANGERHGDTMTGDYETSFDCGGAKLTTWYYDEEHMPTGYLMNALVEVGGPAEAAPFVCHSVKDKDARGHPAKDDLFENDDVLHILDMSGRSVQDGAADDDDAAADDDDEADDDRMEGGRTGVHRVPGRRQDLQLPRRSHVPRVRLHGRARPQEANHPRLRQDA